jgi:hypothetical protein
MKRLFISLLVFVMASTSGAFQISVNGDKSLTDYISSSGNCTLDIWTDTVIRPGIGEGYFALVVDTSRGTIDYTSGIVVPPYYTDPGIYLEHSMGAAEVGFPLPSGEDGIIGGVALAVLSSIPASATIFDEILFHSDLPFADVMVKLYVTNDFETSYLADVVVIHTPEPMTIGLLGLGVLFLRRRK